MAPRFFASPYKNAVAQVGKKDTWWSELPVSTSAASDSSDLVKTSSDYWLAQGNAVGSLICLPYESSGKFNQKTPTLQAASRAITDFDVSRFDDLIAAGSDDGKISIHALPALGDFSEASALAPASALVVNHPAARQVDTLSFHPTTSSLLLAGSGSIVAVYDVESQALEAAYTLEQPKPIWSAHWSSDGRSISTTGKDGILRVYDVRSHESKPSQETTTHAGLKCSRHVWLNDGKIFTTGFNKMREREYSLFDGRDFGLPLKSQRLDNNMGVLMPVLDPERSIVYLAGRGDMTLRWVEVGGPATFTEGGAALPIAISSFALAPSSCVNLMKAEINRCIVLTSDAVLPIPIEVPRRQYVDFHQDLFPPVAAREPAQTAQAWREGANDLPELIAQHPDSKLRPRRESRLSTPAPSSNAPQISAAVPSSEVSEARVVLPKAGLAAQASPETKVEEAPTNGSTLPASANHQLSTPKAAGTASSRPIFGSKSTLATPSPSTPSAGVASMSLDAQKPKSTPSTLGAASPNPQTSKTYNPQWSRAFLLGKTPLKPTYHDVHGLNSTMGADCQSLKANSSYMFFPLAGAGGRLGVHPVKRTGRLPVNIPSLVCGASIVEFEIDTFEPKRVFIANDDSKIRVFELPEAGLEDDLGEPTAILGDTKMDRIVELKHHPTARDLLLTISDDHGNPTLRLWDTGSKEMLKSVALPKGSVSSAAWSPDGSRLAIATKTKQIHVLDPRSSEKILTTPSHDSIRPVRICWADDSHLLSTGFSRSASREIILYSISDSSVFIVAKQSLDVSPAPLFPHFDLDTHILFLYSRGDRSTTTYQVTTTNPKSPFVKLPSFDTGTLQSGFAFLPKQSNDIRSVEIVRAFRLTPATIEVISFSIPRKKAEFFQDDIFVPTRDTERPALSAKEWMQGKNETNGLVDLRPEGMTPLSEAPSDKPIQSTRSKIEGPYLTDSQIQDAYMDRLFQAAKDDGDEDVIKSKHAPDDDDW